MLKQVELKLRGTWTSNVNREPVPLSYNPCSLYIQLSHCPTLDGIILLFKVKERDFIENMALYSIAMARKCLDKLSEATGTQLRRWQLAFKARKVEVIRLKSP